MAQLNINIGTPNNEDGDFVRDAFSKAQSNFTELYGKTNTSDFINDGENGTSTFVETDELGATAFSNNYNDLDDKPIFTVVENEYADISALYTDQANQTDTFIQYVLDATGFPTVTSGAKYFEYLGTTNGDSTDYRLLTDEEAEVVTPIFQTLHQVTTNGNKTTNNVFLGTVYTNRIESNNSADWLTIKGNQGIYLVISNPNTGNIRLGTSDLIYGLSNNVTKLNTRIRRNFNDTLVNSGIKYVGLVIDDIVDMTTKTGDSYYTALRINPALTGTNNVYSIRSENGDALFNNGTLTLSDYGDGTVTDTPTYGAAFNADGKLIEVPLGGGSGGAVDSVNGQTGDVVLDADDISDTSTTNKFVTATEKGLISTALQPSAISNEAYNATTWDSATPGDAAETTAPSKNAIRDKIETLATLDTLQSFTAPKRFTNSLIITADGTNTNDYIRFEGNNNSAPTGNPTIGVSQDKLYFTFDNFTPSSPTVGYRASFTGNKDFTTNRTFTFPNKSGTIALLDDIVGGGSGDYSEWATYSGTRAGSNLSLTLGDYDNSGNGSKISINDATGLITLTGAGGNYFSISGGGDANLSTNLYMSLGNSYAWTQGGYSMRLRRPTTLTQNSELLIPEGNQTIPISVNGNYANSAGDITISTGGSTTINNTLTSTSTTEALSANMGKTLKDVQDTQQIAINLNTAKVTNATHTGEVTGSGALTLDSTAISNKTLDTSLTGTEEVLINDGGLKKTTTKAIANLAVSNETYSSSWEGVETVAPSQGSMWDILSYFMNLEGSIVNTTDNQTIEGIKTFDEFPITPSEAPTEDYQVANRKFVLDNIGGNTVNTEFQAETYSATFNYAFDPENPNKYIDLTGNIDIEIFGTVNGDAGSLYLNRGTGSETIEFSNGIAPLNKSYPTKPTDVVELYFVHSDSGIQWYLQNPTQQPKLSQTLLGNGTTTIDFTKGNIVKFLFGSSNETFTIIPPVNNSEVVITFKQDATGGRTATLPINFGGVGSTTPTALSTAANAMDYRKFDYIDGYFYPTSIVNDVQFDKPAAIPIYGTVINDSGGANSATSADKAFDGNPATHSSRFNSANAWVGQDYGEPVIINRFRALPRQDGTNWSRINNSDISYSNNGTTWTTVYNISGVDAENYTDYIDVTFSPISARYWRIITLAAGSYGGVAELEFYLAE